MPKEKKSTALATKGPEAMINWEEEMAKDAVDAASHETLNAPRISFEGGRIKINDQIVKEGKLNVIIADFGCEKAYYSKPFKKGEGATPDCYAFGRDEDELAPGDVPNKQAEKCSECPHNRFGTAIAQDGSPGKGKRCSDKRRLMVIPADTAPEDLHKAEVYLASVPPTSLVNWKNYVKGLAVTKVPPHGAMTELTLEPFGSIFKAAFRFIDRVSGGVYTALKTRRATGEIEKQMFAPYPVIEAKEDAPPPKANPKRAAKTR